MAGSGGRKVYRNRMKAKKKRSNAAVRVILFVILIVALVFVGYSIANPILKYFNEKRDNDSVSTEPWTPPKYVDDEDIDVTTENSESKDNKSNNDKTTKNATDIDYSAYVLPVSALADAETLKAELVETKNNGYNAVVVVLKDKGGAIYYDTRSEMARSDENAVKGKMPIAQISTLISASGLKPIASLNLLEDNNRYGEKRKGSYRFASDDSTWLDNAVSNGGKPWLSPFDTDTQSYIEFLVTEVTTVGFDTVICDGLVFPTFRNSDLSYLGSTVQDSNRYNALINVANIAKNSAEAANSNAMISVSANDILTGKSEVFKPELMQGHIFVVYYSPSEFAKSIIVDNNEVVLSDLSAFDKTTIIFEEISKRAGNNVKILPYVYNDNLNQSDFNDTMTALISLGFESYIVK